MLKFKKFISILLLGAITLSSVGCSKQGVVKNNDQSEGAKVTASTVHVNTKISIEKLGIKFDTPKSWIDNVIKNLFAKQIYPMNQNEEEAIFGALTYYFSPEEINKEFRASEKQEENYKKAIENSKLLVSITVFSKANLERELNSGKKLEDYINGENIEKLGEEGEYAFYFSYDEVNDEGLKDEDKAVYKEMYSGIEDVKNTLEISEPYKFDFGYIGDFNTKDLQGNNIDTSIFEDYKLTMVNVWGTGCNPCIREMPELEELYQEMKDNGVNVVGIVTDGDNEKRKENIEKIIEMTGVTYPNIIPDEVLKKGLLSQVIGYPTTVFFDSKGNVVGKEVVGAGSKDYYEKAIEERLENIK
ncbi:TlpA disulfide reductase family protein [Oceanirhabdus seepicola]|uniref:TlpA family protein disulfide reductase n=1 Tax=Oceanirhabdus seepicola TaxID=2828781 RepID=A0A9J6NYS6_9CLOT|nr:TlpA disulfide reductase family protein [Oceanirhabdus seepicola]MCM1989057.1 TlpA family protein disulfide reductase [Oceanirhabdus seepicola]